MLTLNCFSIEGHGLCTSVHYKPTDLHNYLLYSSSHPSHAKNSIPFSRFLRLRRLCSDDSDFHHKSESICQFFDKPGYPVSVVQAGYHRAQLIGGFQPISRDTGNNGERKKILVDEQKKLMRYPLLTSTNMAAMT